MLLTYWTVSRPICSDTTRSTLPNHTFGLSPRRAASRRNSRIRRGPALYAANVIRPLLRSSILQAHVPVPGAAPTGVRGSVVLLHEMPAGDGFGVVVSAFPRSL